MGDLSEIHVFLSFENDDPKALAEELAEAIASTPLAAGVDALTGDVFLRFYHAPGRVAAIQRWLAGRGAHSDVEEVHG